MKKFIRRVLFRVVHVLAGSPATFMKRFCYFAYASKIFKDSQVEDFLDDREGLYSFIIESESLDQAEIDFMEFGVCKGVSFRFWVEHCKNDNAKFFGFDTFEGLPEDWGNSKKGAYSADGKLPKISDPRASFFCGLFNDTLKPFLRGNKMHRRKVIHLDADLYSSTLYVLVHLDGFMVKDDIIIFDEFFSVTKADHEMRAFLDYLCISGRKYVPIAKTDNQLAIKISE